MSDRPLKLSLMDFDQKTQTQDEIVDDLFKSRAYYDEKLATETDPLERRSLQDAKAMIVELLRANAPGGFQMLKQQIAVLRDENARQKEERKLLLSDIDDLSKYISTQDSEIKRLRAALEKLAPVSTIAAKALKEQQP